MTSGNVTIVSPNVTVNTKAPAKDDKNPYSFVDVMNKNVDRVDKNVASDTKKVSADTSDKKMTNKAESSKSSGDADKASTTKTDVKKETAKTEVKSKDEPKENAAVINDTNEAMTDTVEVEEIPAEVAELINDILSNFQSEVKDVLATALDITEEELENVMQDMGITFADLLSPKQVTELMVEVADVEDSVSLVLDEKLSDALSTVRDLATEAMSEAKMEAPVIKEIEPLTKGSIEIPKEMTEGKMAEVDPVVLEEAVSKASDPKMTAPITKEANESLVQNVSQSEEEPTEGVKVIVNETSKDVKAKNTETSDETVKTDTDNANDKTFTVKQSSDAQSHSNFKGHERHDNNPGQLEANVVVNNQNPEAQVQTTPEARPVISRFQTMSMISQIAEAARVNLEGESTTLEMILNPESLGKIYLNVSSKEGNLKAQLMTENEIVKEALENQMVALKENLNKAGIKVEAVEVSVATHEFEKNLEEGMHQQEEQARQQEEQASKTRKPISINLNNLDEMQGLMSEDDKLMAQMMRDRGNTMSLQA